MRIAAYQFQSTTDHMDNFHRMVQAIRLAAEQNVRLLTFPSYALSGFPTDNQMWEYQLVELSKHLFSYSELYCMDIIFGAAARNDLFQTTGRESFLEHWFVAIPPEHRKPIQYIRLPYDHSPKPTSINRFYIWKSDRFRVDFYLCYPFNGQTAESSSDVLIGNKSGVFLFCEPYEGYPAEVQMRMLEGIRLKVAADHGLGMGLNNCFPKQTISSFSIDRNGTCGYLVPCNSEGLISLDLA
ncbi:MAG: hypothetical protein LLF75_09180 [Eubacteriales bacterium]|nr:hypothetical protein [Eubacteriales bacterium]